jgi:hypothetical protein
MADDCEIKLMDPKLQKELFGDRDIPKQAIKAVLRDIQKIKSDFDKGLLKDTTYKAKVAAYLEEKRQLDNVQSMLKKHNMFTIRNELEYVSQPGFEGRSVEAHHSQLTKSKTLANASGLSVEARGAVILDKVQSYLTDVLEEKKLLKVFSSGQLDLEIRQDVEALAGIGKASGNADALEIAKAVTDLNKYILREYQLAGFPIRELQGFVSRQTHEISKVREAGFDTWKAKLLNEYKLNMEKTFGVEQSDAKAMDQILKNIYDNISAGKYGLDNLVGDKEIGDHYIGLGATKSLVDKASEHRTLHFADAKSAHGYNLEFGKGSLSETLMQEARRMSTTLALFERFGDKPMAAFDAGIERNLSRLKQKAEYFKKAGDLEKSSMYAKDAEKLQGSKERLMSEFREVSMTRRHPGNETLAQLGYAARSLQVLSKLWNVGLRSMSNVAPAIMEVRNATGENFFEAMNSTVSTWLKSVPEGFRNTYLSEASDFFNDLRDAQMQGVHLGGETQRGLMSKLTRFQSKYGGILSQNMSNETTQLALSYNLQRKFAGVTDRKFSELHPKTQSYFLQVGINSYDWEVVRKGVETAADGRRYLTPESVERLHETPDSAISEAINTRGVKMSPERYTRDLGLKLRAGIYQTVNVATTTATARERSFWKFGNDLGTGWGETIALFSQFKTFTSQSVYNAERFLNAKPDADLLAKGILKSQGKDLTGFAAYLVTGMATAYMADTLIRMATGKELKDPRDVGTMFDAFSKSSAGGMHVDFFMGQWDKYNWAETFAGPTYGNIPKIGSALTDAWQGDFVGGKREAGGYSKGFTPTMVGVVRSNTPFQQAPLVTNALNFLQYDMIQGTLQPRYHLNRQRRLEKEKLKRSRE